MSQAFLPFAAESHILNPTILRAYDIRGVYGDTLTDEDAFWLGKAYATYVARHAKRDRVRLAMAYDGRVSSPALQKRLQEGMVAAGAQVVNIGVGPTPMLYFSVHHLGLDGGIMVTGSHNPPHHNGFKMMLGKKSLFGEQIQELNELLIGGVLSNGTGQVEHLDVRGDYLKALLKGYPADTTKTLRVAWDPGNGAAGEIVQRLVPQLPGGHVVINAEIDGAFPNHHPDPTVPANLKQLIDTVLAQKCDVGIAFDGDADRLGVVDSQGRILWGDQLMVLYAREILSRKPGATIIADVKASQVLFDDIANHGGQPLMWKTGHSLVKAKMAETKAELAGEMSGHIFFADGYFGFDDGVYAAIRLLALLANSEQTLDEMFDSLPKVHNTPEIRIDCDESRKFKIAEELQLRLQRDGADVSTIDGVRVRTPEGWWLCRASNTQAALIVRCEANSEAGLESLRAQAKAALAACGVMEWNEVH